MPRAILSEIGLAVGAEIDLQVADGKLIGTPVASATREGWAHAAAMIGAEETAEEVAWRGFGIEEDSDLTW